MLAGQAGSLAQGRGIPIQPRGVRVPAKHRIRCRQLRHIYSFAKTASDGPAGRRQQSDHSGLSQNGTVGQDGGRAGQPALSNRAILEETLRTDKGVRLLMLAVFTGGLRSLGKVGDNYRSSFLCNVGLAWKQAVSHLDLRPCTVSQRLGTSGGVLISTDDLLELCCPTFFGPC